MSGPGGDTPWQDAAEWMDEPGATGSAPGTDPERDGPLAAPVPRPGVLDAVRTVLWCQGVFGGLLALMYFITGPGILAAPNLLEDGARIGFGIAYIAAGLVSVAVTVVLLSGAVHIERRLARRTRVVHELSRAGLGSGGGPVRPATRGERP